VEAAVAGKEAEMTEWNEGRLDDLGERVDRIETKMDAGFARLDKKMGDGFARIESKFDKVDEKFVRFEKKMDDGFARIDVRCDALQRSLTQIAWTFGIGMLTFACALIGVIAAKL
jgi:hypothetical protein